MGIRCGFSPMGEIKDRYLQLTFDVSELEWTAIFYFMCSEEWTGYVVFERDGESTISEVRDGVFTWEFEPPEDPNEDIVVKLKNENGRLPMDSVEWGGPVYIRSVDYANVAFGNMESDYSYGYDWEEDDYVYMCQNTEWIPLWLDEHTTYIHGGLLANMPNLTSVSFSGTSISSISPNMFMNNPNLTSLEGAFSNCTSLTSVPAGLFRNQYNLETVESIFEGCSSLTTVPSNLFANNVNISNFSKAFKGCVNLTVVSDLFSDSAHKSTRFTSLSTTPNFTQCFNRTSFTGSVQGTAPDLWNYTFNSTPTKTGCFSGNGNSASSLTNYASIPSEWK